MLCMQHHFQVIECNAIRSMSRDHVPHCLDHLPHPLTAVTQMVEMLIKHHQENASNVLIMQVSHLCALAKRKISV